MTAARLLSLCLIGLAGCQSSRTGSLDGPLDGPVDRAELADAALLCVKQDAGTCPMGCTELTGRRFDRQAMCLDGTILLGCCGPGCTGSPAYACYVNAQSEVAFSPSIVSDLLDQGWMFCPADLRCVVLAAPSCASDGAPSDGPAVDGGTDAND